MPNISPTSRTQLQSRRQTLRRRRRLSVGRSLWRWVAMAGLTGTVLWGATRPVWMIQSPHQIQVSGNEWLSDEALQALVPLHYPQSLLEVEPDEVAQQLKQRAPLADVRVSRRILPPGLKVQVQERVPVAVVVSSPSRDGDAGVYLPDGFMDAEGAWMPLSSFGLQAAPGSDRPTLRLRGVQAQYQRDWPQIYAALRSSPITIHELDWHDPSNLILHTDLGLVYLGAYGPDLGRQLATLDRMRNLPQHISPTQVAHIDLTNPDHPSLAHTDSSSEVTANLDPLAPRP